jgi:hypothetical protein
MSVPDEMRRDAEQTGALVRKKLLEIMELQADIDTLLRGDQPTPFGAKNWQYASLEALQRLILFEPVGRVKRNEEFKVAADGMIGVIIAQLKTLKTKKSDW